MYKTQTMRRLPWVAMAVLIALAATFAVGSTAAAGSGAPVRVEESGSRGGDIAKAGQSGYCEAPADVDGSKVEKADEPGTTLRETSRGPHSRSSASDQRIRTSAMFPLETDRYQVRR